MAPPTAEETAAPPALGILGFGGGLALVAAVLSGVSLAATLVVVLGASAVAGRWLWRRSPPGRRLVARDRLRAGLAAGAAAVAAYDLSRWLMVEVLGLRFRPFEAFGAFGRLMWGEGGAGWWVTASGVGLHVLNGVGFAVGYTMVAGRRGPLAGVAFALGLEAAMVALYPGWLRLRAVDEFLQVSMVGHAVYGATLGWAARATLRRPTGSTPAAVAGP